MGGTRRSRGPGTAVLRARVVFVLAIVVHVLVLYAPAATVPEAPPVPHLDKLLHGAVFAAVAWTGRRAGAPPVPLVVLLLVHAGVSELGQDAAGSGRSGDPWDAAADVAGVALGALLPVRRPAVAERSRQGTMGG